VSVSELFCVISLDEEGGFGWVVFINYLFALK
jgi:hypothetical protein